MPSRLHLLRLLFPVAAFGALVTGCGSTETAADDHDPASYKLMANGTEMTQPYTIAWNQTTRIRVKFYNAAGEDLDDVESEHFGALEFTPSALAAATRLADHHFQFDVVAGTEGTGTVTVRFGHDEETDEVAFDPVEFRVVSP